MIKKIYACDFETTTLKKSSEETSVYLWCAIDVNKEKEFYGEDIESFFYFMKNNIGADFYFHNLKFDGIFILDWLLFHSDFQYNETGKFSPNTFNTLISEELMFYKIEIHFDDGKVHILDSLKKFAAGTSIAKMATDFETGLEKLKYDYDTEKPNALGYMYIRSDTLILARGLKKIFKNGSKEMTIGADAYSYWKDGYKKYEFERLFPELSIEEDTNLRKYYKGGYTYVNRYYRNKIFENINGCCYDKNSMYPTQMYENAFPIGKPRYFKGKYQDNSIFDLYVQHIKCYFVIKDNMPPMVQRGYGRFKRDYILSNLEKPEAEDLYFTSIDLQTFFTCYDVFNLEYIDGYMFRSKKDIFKSYIRQWYYMKTVSSGAMKSYAKLMLNSLYGKFGENPNVISRIPFKKGDIVGFKKTEPRRKKHTKYIPIALFITSYARQDLIYNIIKLGGDSPNSSFIYCDTDSLHCIDDRAKDILKIDDYRLGYWKKENGFNKCKFIRPKCYFESNENKNIVRIAGMPITQAETIGFDEFDYNVSRKKLIPKIVRGGVLLVTTDYVLRK